ncbi:hypothetical protein CRG98_025064 [Punica granatum]|uniref:Uncharacterized protein n=1 Tax=Punica granatum TaxID=22663 RepID=A0A2I0JF52_PUNGR|nr:hypothetical protein CRG98_025064 [Punica granatum]
MEERATITRQKCLKKLNLNIPLLSVRRLGSCSHNFEEASSIISRQGLPKSDTSERVPFSWEQAPGKPKARPDQLRLHEIISADQPPRPKPPPGRWHQQHPTENIVIKEDGADGGDDQFMIDSCSLDDHNCCSNYNSDDVVRDRFSDAVDTISLSEAIDILEKSDRVHELDASKLKMVEAAGNLSPSFMINRFLPDANALAVESFCSRPNLHRDYWMITNNGDGADSSSRTSCCSNYNKSSKGYYCTDDEFLRARDHEQLEQPNMKVCGLQNLFSWRMKHRLNLRC